MSLTPEQLAIRKNAIGASEVAAVLGLSPWESAADVYYRKVGDVEPEKATDAMELGNTMEPAIVAWAAQQLNVKIETNCPTIMHPTMPLCVTPDGRIVGRREGVQAKLSSFPDQWGEPGSDEIPQEYIAQVQDEMFVLGFERIWVPVLLIGYRAEMRMYCVNRNDELAGEIAHRATDWWKKHVVARVAPDNAPPAIEFLKRLRRQPASQVMLGQQAVEAVDKWETAKVALKIAEEAKDAAQAAVLALLGIDSPAEAGVLPDGREITYLQQRNPPSVNRDMLLAKYPQAHAECVTQTMRRQLRIKKGKS